jgi:chromosome segregation protein
MRLSAIKLAGFKSFVDPTMLALASNRTAVVGPNGCGKSNVIDAVRWVTGESSARALRGEALEDVIFNGSRARKPIGRAAVTLIFDNSDGKLGGAYAAFTEISVARELVRDGPSRYFINGTRARRRDVVDLFLGTGLGGRSNYAVIEQGAVNRLIEARPEEMRQILEEAAGISRYKQRRHETENRIRHTRENLDRLNDLIGPLRQRLAVLKRQAANAEKYKRLKADERRARAELLALRWVEQNARTETAEADLRAREEALATAVADQREARSAREAAQKAQQAATEAVQMRQAAFYDAQSQAARIAQALAHARELGEMRARERDELARRADSLDTREHDDREADAQLCEQQRQTRAAHDKADAEQTAARAAAQHAARAVADAEAAWDELNAEGNPLGQLDAERRRANYAEERLDQLQKRQAARAVEREQLGAAEEAEIAEAEQALAAREARLKAEQQAVREVGEAEEALAQTIAEAERAVQTQRAELGETQAALVAEKKLQQAVLREDDAAIVRWLKSLGVVGALAVARRVVVRRSWQRAAEAALGPWLRGFLVTSLPTIDDEPPGQPVCLIKDTPGDPTTTPTGPDGAPSLAEGLDAPAAIKAIAARVFVIEDAARALALRTQLQADQQLVTLDGYCIGCHSLITPANDAAEQGVLEREKRINTLAAQLAESERDYEAQQQALTAEREQQRTLRARRAQLERDLSESRRVLETARAELEGRRRREQQRQQRREELDTERAELAGQIDTASTEAAAAARRIEALTVAAEIFSGKRRTAQDTLAAARAERDQARTVLDDAQQKQHKLDAQLEQLAGRREAIAARHQDTQQTRAEIAARWVEFDADTDVSATAPSEDEHTRARDAQVTAERELRADQTRLEAAKNTLQTANQNLMRAEQAVETAREALQAAQIEAETASVRRAGVAEQLEALGEDPAALAATLPEDATAAATSAAIAAIERKIQRLGAINLAAVGEYEAEAQREAYLQDQYADLTAALATLEAAIAKIDRETKSRFKATYTQVDARFSQLFPELFGGGEAALARTEDDWLAAGVKVTVRPPGKRKAAIQSLSGGEKALAAVALLFALFELNPAPFCMLDEIDAPLDDANVARFCELVRRMAARVQFIVITHNKLTMELAEQLHGVTMAEPGVSRLVSVDIEQALDMAG